MSTQIVSSTRPQKELLSEATNKVAQFRLSGYATVIGALCFVIGAILWSMSGTDIDLAVTNGDMAAYLLAAAQNSTVLIANLAFWITGALVLGFAGVTMAQLGQQRILGQLAEYCYRTAVPVVIISYFAMLAVNVVLASATSEAALSVAHVVGWLGSRADWLATILIIGLGPLFIAHAGQDNWVPTWLKRMSYLNGFCALLTTVALFTGALGSYGFVLVPVGMIWMLAAGVAQLQHATTLPN